MIGERLFINMMFTYDAARHPDFNYLLKRPSPATDH
jgi:hypothetical protein